MVQNRMIRLLLCLIATGTSAASQCSVDRQNNVIAAIDNWTIANGLENCVVMVNEDIGGKWSNETNKSLAWIDSSSLTFLRYCPESPGEWASSYTTAECAESCDLCANWQCKTIPGFNIFLCCRDCVSWRKCGQISPLWLPQRSFKVSHDCDWRKIISVG